MEKIARSRKIGRVESFLGGLQLSKVYNNFNIAATYTKPIEAPILAIALRNVLLKHTMLVCNIINNNVQIVNKIIFKDVVTYLSGETSLDSTFNKLSELRLPYDDDSAPLWRIYIGGPSNTLVNVVLDHITSDGMSGVNFHKCLVSELNKIQETKLSAGSFDENTVLFDYDTDSVNLDVIPPPIEDIVNYKPPVSDEPPVVRDLWQTEPLTKIDSEQIFKTMHFTIEETSKIKQLCKVNNVKVISFLQVCFSVAHGQIESNFNESLMKDMIYGVDSRRYIPSTTSIDPLFGANISLNFPAYKSLKEFHWEDVKSVSDDLTELIDTGSVKYIMGGPIYTIPQDTWPHVHASTGLGLPRGHLLMGNLGYQKMVLDKDAEYEIEYMYFSQSAYALNYLYGTNAITTKSGMSIVSSIVKDSVEAVKFDELLSIYRSLLLQD